MKTSRKIMAPVIMRRLLQTLVVCLVAFTSLNAPALERVTYYHNDALGSPVAATDSSGNLLWREEYEPYGERILREDGGTNSLWFTGTQEEEAFGISYFGARWYDPGIGRFMGVDPIGFNSDDIQSFNRYAYADNNPYVYVDPDGKLPIAPLIIFVAKEVAAEVVSRLTGLPALNLKGLVKGGIKGAGKLFGRSSTRKDVTKKAPEIKELYKRPSGATTKAQRESVQGKPCVKCGDLTERQVAGHKKALVEEHFETGAIDKKRMRSLDAVQPECPTCSAKEGAAMARFSRQKKKELGL
jgi:RHS repeat-associated protein